MVNFNNPRKDFPILKRKIRGKPLIYFDNGATSQKPKQVIKAVSDFYAKHNANIHRGAYRISEEAALLYEKTREKSAEFIGADFPEEIVFTKGATEAINLAAKSWGEKNIKRGDNIVTTVMEHHSNFVPWQIIAKRKRAELRIVGTTKKGGFSLEEFNKLADKKTKLVALTHASNTLGSILPVEKVAGIIKTRKLGAKLLVDATQTVPHLPVSVKKLGCDFLAFSGHKMLGPTGVGVLFAKKEILEGMPPFLFGGQMIKEVSSKETSFNDIPWKFEAGTPNIAQVVGLGKAVDYLKEIGLEKIKRYEEHLTDYALGKLNSFKNIEIYGPENPKKRIGIIAFNLKGVHSHDLATLMDQEGIAIRAGHHCAMPLHREVLGVESSSRISFYLYNVKEEIDRFLEALKKAQRILGF